MSVAVIGAGPNGLAAAITLAQAGLEVEVFERNSTPGGGCQSSRPIIGECIHDHCASVFPLAAASPFFRSLKLGFDWLEGPAVLAHPLDDQPAVLLYRSLDQTVERLGRDAGAYRRLFAPLIAHYETVLDEVLRPLGWPGSPVRFAKFAFPALLSMRSLNGRLFQGECAKTLMAGMAAHAAIPLDAVASSATALVLGMLGHTVGWPIAAGGAQVVTDALIERLRVLGGRVSLSRQIGSIDELGWRTAVVFDTSPTAMSDIAGNELPERFGKRLRRFRHGPGAFKMDWVLDGPIPWRDECCAEAVTVHLGGTADEIAHSESEVWGGRISEQPFVILAQPSIVDSARAPAGKQVVWAYCHVPSGSTVDMTGAIEAQIERFAPGFRERIFGRRSTSPAQFEAQNPNLIGGDISGGSPTIGQLFARPYLSCDPYRTPNRKLYLGSASAAPGGGVHGMSGFNAARSLLARLATG